MAEDQGQTQEVRYRVSVDPGDVHSTIQEIEAAANRASSSITAMAGNILSTLRSQASDSFGVTNMASRDAMMMAYGNMPRPGMGQMGPSMVSPLGLPSVNMFRPGAFNGGYNYQQPFTAMNAPMFAPPPSPLLYPTHPAVQAQARSIAGRGEGGFGDVGRQLWRLGALGRGSVVPDSMNETVYRHIEGSSEAFGRNMGKFVGGDLPGLGMTAASMAAFAAGVPVAGWGLGLGAMAAGLPYQAMRAAGQPYATQADMLREFTAPYLRGSRLGPGMSGRETAQTQRQMVEMVNNDKFFTSQEYTDLLGAANNAGVFQFSGSKDQMMRSIEKMADNLKTLHALGKTAEERLRMYDQMYSTFGVSQHSDSQRFANIATLAQVTGMATGTDAATAMERAQMTAQQGMSQGLGPAFAGKIGMFNQMSAGAMFRSNTFAGGFANAYFGGQQGLSESLNQADLAVARSPWGQMALISAIDSKGRFADGASMDMQSVLGRLGRMNPYQMLENQMFSPLYTQYANGAGFTRKMESDAIDRYKRMFPEASGEQIMAMLGRDFGWTQDQTIAKTLELSQAKEVQADMARNAMDVGRQVAMESRRGMGLERWWDKTWERAMSPLAEANAKHDEWWNRTFAEPYQRIMSGENSVNLRHAGTLGMDPVALQKQQEIMERLQADGFRMPRDTRGVEQVTQEARAATMRKAMEDPRFQRLAEEGLRKKGFSGLEIAGFRTGFGLSGDRRSAIEKALLEVTSDIEGAQAKHITTIQGMNDVERMSDKDRDRISSDMNDMLNDTDFRGRLETILADPNADVDTTLSRMKRLIGGKANLSEEEELSVARKIALLDGGKLSRRARGGLSRVKDFQGIDANWDAKTAETMIKDRDKWAERELIMNTGTTRARNAFMDVIRDGNNASVAAIELGTIYQRLGALGNDDKAREQVFEEMRDAYGFKTVDEAYAKVGFSKNMTTQEISKAAIDRRDAVRREADGLAISDFDMMTKGLGLRQAIRVSQGVQTRNTGITAQVGGGTDEQFAANINMLLKGIGVGDQTMKAIEKTHLGGKSITELFSGNMSAEERVKRIGMLSSGLLSVGGIENVQDLDFLKVLRDGGSPKAILKKMGLEDKTINAMKSDEEMYDYIGTMAKFRIDRMAPNDGRLATNNVGANMPSAEAMRSLTSALSEVTVQSKELTQVADKLNFDKISKVLEYINNTEVGGKQKTDKVTIDANTIVIQGKGGKDPVVEHNGTGITDGNGRTPIQPKQPMGSDRLPAAAKGKV